MVFKYGIIKKNKVYNIAEDDYYSGDIARLLLTRRDYFEWAIVCYLFYYVNLS